MRRMTAIASGAGAAIVLSGLALGGLSGLLETDVFNPVIFAILEAPVHIASRLILIPLAPLSGALLLWVFWSAASMITLGAISTSRRRRA